MKYWILLFSLISCLASAEPNACNSVYEAANIISKNARRIEKSAEALGRPLKEVEIAALKNIFEKFNANYVTQDQFLEQIGLLKKARFSEPDIRKLREVGVLAKDKILHGKIPDSIIVLDKNYSAFAKSHLTELKSGKTLYYFVDEDNKVQITSKLKISPDEIPLYKGNTAGTSGVVKQYGTMRQNPISKKIEMQPKFSLDLMDGETEAILKEAAKTNPEIALAKAKNPGVLKSRLLKCNDISSGKKTGGNYVLDSMLSSNAVMISALTVGEIGGAGRLSEESSREVVYADLAGTNINNLATLPIYSKIAMSNMSFKSTLAARGGLGIVTMGVQNQIYAHATSGGQSSANSIAGFDASYSALRLPMRILLDKYIIHKLPDIILNSCYKNSKLQFMISPRMIRMYDAYGATMIYYGARKGIIDK